MIEPYSIILTVHKGQDGRATVYARSLETDVELARASGNLGDAMRFVCEQLTKLHDAWQYAGRTLGT